MIKTAVKFGNNMVMVFDKGGEQITEYQGKYEIVKESLLSGALPETIFAIGFTNAGELREVPREEW